MKETEKTSPYPILSVNGRKGQSGEQKSPSRGGGFRGSFNSSPILGEVGRGNGLTKRGTWRRAFTLVELIIVITILAILATIAFMSFQGYTSKSRDSNRASTAKNIETWLSLFQVKAGVYPIQSTWATISLSWTPITVQWNFDESIARVINLNEVPKDPKTGDPYHYISDTKGKGWKVLYYLENSPDYAFLTQSFAESETRTPIVKGQWPWVLLDTGSQMVTKNVDLFGATQSWETFTILVSDGLKIPWTGLELWGGFQNFAEKWGRLDAPKNCPTGFIPVPWNAEFMQPWFCVAKYEMGYENITVPNTCNGTGCPWVAENTLYQTDWNTVKYSSTGRLESKAWLYPIADISQTQAIAECQRIWKHLITNNEWMTIARNIEANPLNWSWGMVGVGGIYRGITWEGNTAVSLWCQTSSSSGSWTRTYVSRAWSTDTTKWWSSKWADCDSKRQHKLSNGEVIWDLSGNVWEHVNGRNTMNTDNIGTLKWNGCNGASDNWYSFTNNAITDSITQCNFTNGYSYKNIWPKTPNLNANNGIGRIRSYSSGSTLSDRVFLRGGDANYGDSSGVFTMNWSWYSSGQYRSVGFRCSQ